MAVGEGRPISEEELDHRFSFHPATTDDLRSAHAHVREVCKHAAEALVETVPPGREASLMVSALEEAMFWANAGIARAGGARESGA